MRKFLNTALLSASLLFSSSHVSAADFYSHVVLNLPFGLQTDEQWVRIISSSEEWAAFYQDLVPPLGNWVPNSHVAPEIDFDLFMIVAGGLGFRGTGGDRLANESVIDSTNAVYVNAIHVSSGPGCSATTQVTYPTVAIMIRRTEKPITVYLQESVIDCD